LKTGVLSIREEFADAIFRGIKRYEFRTKAPTITAPTRFLVYVPAPRKELVGEITIGSILTGSPKTIWDQTNPFGGISEEQFRTYFRGRAQAHALRIDSKRQYREAIPLEDLRDRRAVGFSPPQYLSWLSPADAKQLCGA
jgi:predicted transcriptional regulator